MLEKVSREIPASFPLGPAWHVIHTLARSEFRTVAGIVALGFEAYTPIYRTETRHARQKQIVNRPAFTRYVFAQFDIERDEWGEILSVDGVEFLIGQNGVPTRVPAEIIGEVKRLEAIGFFDNLTSPAARFAIGEIVRISDGPFDGHSAEFLMDNRKNVEVMASIFGQKTKMQLPLEYLEKL